VTGPGGAGPSGNKTGSRRGRWLWLVFAAVLVLNWIIASAMLGPPARTRVPYTFFIHQVQTGNVRTITSTADTIEGQFKTKVAYTPQGGGHQTEVTRFVTERPAFADDNLLQLLQSKSVVINANSPDRAAPIWQQLLLGFGPTLLFVGLLVWFYRRAGSGAGPLGGINKSRAKLYEPTAAAPRTTFADVAGIDEVENEVLEIVDFLKEPQKYRALGAQVPRGVLLSGPPGTGKTLLARAVAGEANVPFFSVSASEFIELIVGVGASRVRDLFDQAKKVAPSIIFIDELDAIGRARGGASSIGGNDEREQTLNQILTEMDGFTGNENVIVLAATNRPEVLDPALLRPGRFDRRVVVSAPDAAGRRQILQVHTRSVPLAPDVDLTAIAAGTAGMVGADLKNLVNEAALTAARRGATQVGSRDFSDAIEKVTLGTARGIMLTAEDKRRTAYHESGHALLGMLTPGADPVRKVSIIPRGQALGVTFQSPDTDRYAYSARYLSGRITGALGGRAAEEVVFGEVTTGAESDLDQVTRIARQMVGRWGMSDRLGPIILLPPPDQESPFGDSVAPATREAVDAEVRRIVDECYADAVRTLRENRARLDGLAGVLLTRETLDEVEAYAAAGLAHPLDEHPAAAPESKQPVEVRSDVPATKP
jgi:cell division protease FtsH